MSLLPISTVTYDSFRQSALNQAALGQGYDVDGYYGYQCWDMAAELWMNLPAFSGGTLWPKTGPNGYAEECWTVSRVENAGTDFTLITSITSLKRGDVIVIGPSAISSTGHIAFCDENYRGSDMYLLGQNQVDPNLVTGHIPTVTEVDISAFLGAFRYNGWTTPPTPSTGVQRKTRNNKFPWVLYGRKLRDKM